MTPQAGCRVRITALLVAISACATQTGGAFPSALGDCSQRGLSDGLPLEATLGRRGAWVEVRSLDTSEPAAYGWRSVSGDFALRGGDSDAVSTWTASSARLRIHPAMSEDISDALSIGAEVVAHVPDGAGKTSHALAFLADGFAFLGDCQEERSTLPFRARFGDEALATARSLVGRTGQQIIDLLHIDLESQRRVVLNPATAPRALLDSLLLGAWSFGDRPPSWVAPYTVCTRIAKGWNDCLSLDGSELSPGPATMYFDPADPRVEVWLLDERAVSPVCQLGQADMAALARSVGRGLVAGLRLVVTLSPDVSPKQACEEESVDAITSYRLGE